MIFTLLVLLVFVVAMAEVLRGTPPVTVLLHFVVGVILVFILAALLGSAGAGDFRLRS